MHQVVKKAFTLIELLVVIAVIAILAGLLFPVFARVREKARQATCQSNLHQLGIGVRAYIDDYDEMFPFVLNGSANWTKASGGVKHWRRRQAARPGRHGPGDAVPARHRGGSLCEERGCLVLPDGWEGLGV